jgi:hypothetical protein
MKAVRVLAFVTLVAIMLVGANAGKKHSHSGKLSQCSRTFPGCKTCTGTYGEDDYTCEACRNSLTTVFDGDVYNACICNSAEGYGALPWPGTFKGSNCVLCSKYNDASGAPLAAIGPFCAGGASDENEEPEDP